MYWSVVVISKVARADWGDLENCHVMPGVALEGKASKSMDWGALEAHQDQKSAHSSRWDEEGQGSCKTKGKCFLIVFIIENGKWICGCVCVCVCESECIYCPCESHLAEALLLLSVFLSLSLSLSTPTRLASSFSCVCLWFAVSVCGRGFRLSGLCRFVLFNNWRPQHTQYENTYEWVCECVCVSGIGKECKYT